MKDALKLTIFVVIGFTMLLAAYTIGQNRLPNLKYCNASYALDENFRPGTWQPIGWSMSDYPRTDCEMAPDKIVHQDGTWEWK